MALSRIKTPTAVTAAPVEPRRELGLASSTAAVAGEAIAVGIFLTPAGMAKSLGSPLWLLVVWLAVGAMTLSGALCFGELAGRFPRDGGQYVYLHEIFGERAAFLFGWMCLVVLDPGLVAALSTGLGTYAGYGLGWPSWATKVLAVAVIWGLCIINILSLRLSAGFLRWITWLKFATPVFLTVWALAFGLGAWSNFTPFMAQRPGSMALGPALGAATVAAFFSFGGWWDVSKIAGESRDPGRILPRAMTLGVIAVTSIYILITAVFIYLVPIEAITSDETFVAQAGEVLFGKAGGIVFAAIVAVCILGGLAAYFMTAPRVYYAMARDGLFLEGVARVHPRFRTPVSAILIQGVLASVLVAWGTFEEIISYFMFAAIAFLGLTVAGLFWVRRPKANAPRPSMPAPAYPFTPAVFLGLVAVMLVLVALRNPVQTLLGTVVVLSGIPIHAVVRRGLQNRHARVRP